MRCFLPFLLVMISNFALCQVDTRSFLEDPNRIPREHSVDMQHAKIELRFSPEKKRVFGKVTHTFVALQNNLTQLELDGVDMIYKSILVDGQEAGYDQKEKSVTIKLGRKFSEGSNIRYKLNTKQLLLKGCILSGGMIQKIFPESKFGVKAKELIIGIGFRCMMR